MKTKSKVTLKKRDGDKNEINGKIKDPLFDTLDENSEKKLTPAVFLNHTPTKNPRISTPSNFF